VVGGLRQAVQAAMADYPGRSTVRRTILEAGTGAAPPAAKQDLNRIMKSD
jgi:hypothetical protein